MPNSVLGTGRRVLCILQVIPLRTFSQHNRSQYRVRWRAMSTVLQMVLELPVEFLHCDKKEEVTPVASLGILDWDWKSKREPMENKVRELGGKIQTVRVQKREVAQKWF